MYILLPPSETKRIGGSGTLDLSRLAFPEELAEDRALVREALEDLSRDPEAAAKPLKLGKKNADELEHNLRLGESGVMPVIERYTGVFYDALSVETLSPSARAWIDRHVFVQSALFGLISAADRIPAYRLSAGSRLPSLGVPLKRVWRQAHAGVELPGDGLVLDLRSKDYAALAEVPGAVRIEVVQRGADGNTRALNHFNKAAKGDLVRRLANGAAAFGSPAEMFASAGELGIEFGGGTSTATDAENACSPADCSVVELVTNLGAPGASDARASRRAALTR